MSYNHPSKSDVTRVTYRQSYYYICTASMRLPFSVQVFLVRLIDGQRSYLLFHRTARPELGLPDFWQGISGALEAGESFSDAARREVAEETGILLAAVVDSEFRHAYPIRPEWRAHYGPEATEVSEHVFFAQVSSSTAPVLSTEHKSWRWCSLAEAASLLTFGDNARCLQAVDHRLAQMPNLSFEHYVAKGTAIT